MAIIHKFQKGTIFLVLFFISLLFSITFLLRSTQPTKTAIVVLGGGLTKNGELPSWTEFRVLRAVELLKEAQVKNEVAFIIPLSGGTPYKPPPTDEQGFPIRESTAAAHRLLQLGVAAEQILEEAFSLDTIGNAYWLRQIHIEPGGFTKLVIVTNDWHMPRTKAIFDMAFLPHLHASNKRLEIKYVPVESGISDEETHKRRKEKENASLQQFVANVRPKIKTVKDFHQFVFNQHSAYAVSRLKSQRPKIDAKLLETY